MANVPDFTFFHFDVKGELHVACYDIRNCQNGKYRLHPFIQRIIGQKEREREGGRQRKRKREKEASCKNVFHLRLFFSP